MGASKLSGLSDGWKAGTGMTRLAGGCSLITVACGHLMLSHGVLNQAWHAGCIARQISMEALSIIHLAA